LAPKGQIFKTKANCGPLTVHGISQNCSLVTLNQRMAIRNHFDAQRAIYGQQYAISLVDQHGSEVDLGSQYELQVKLLNDPEVR
jgi:hypothetical protein